MANRKVEKLFKDCPDTTPGQGTEEKGVGCVCPPDPGDPLLRAQQQGGFSPCFSTGCLRQRLPH